VALAVLIEGMQQPRQLKVRLRCCTLGSSVYYLVVAHPALIPCCIIIPGMDSSPTKLIFCTETYALSLKASYLCGTDGIPLTARFCITDIRGSRPKPWFCGCRRTRTSCETILLALRASNSRPLRRLLDWPL
jgi:hypothetical protein